MVTVFEVILSFSPRATRASGRAVVGFDKSAVV
jgi:hypothetical protein